MSEPRLIPVAPGSVAWAYVDGLFRRPTLDDGSPDYKLANFRADRRIRAIQLVASRILWERYGDVRARTLAENGGDANELFLFHGTAGTDPVIIWKGDMGGEGIDSRFCSPISANLLGRGTYLAAKAAYR